MRNGFGWRVLLTVALVVAAGVSCRGDTVEVGACLLPLHIILPGEYPFRGPDSDLGSGSITLGVGAEQDLLLALPANERSGWEHCEVPSGNRFVWSTLDSTVARVYPTGDSVARVRAVSVGETGVLVRAVPDTNFRSLRGVTVVPSLLGAAVR